MRTKGAPRAVLISAASTIFLIATPWDLSVVAAAGTNAPERRAFTCDRQQATHVGSSESDLIMGTKGNDVIVTRQGEDLVYGRGGSDTICTGLGADRVIAGEGSDRVETGRGPDRIRGGPDDDSMYSGSGDDVVHGGEGRSLQVAGPGRDRMFGGPSHDNFESPGRDWKNDADLFVGRGDADYFSADPGDDVFDGGEGRDEVSFFRSPTGVDVDLAAGTAIGDGSDTLSSIADLAGSRHADTIRGNYWRNEIFSAPGSDVVYGLNGDDELLDTSGSDWIEGGQGDDQLVTGFCVSGSDGPTRCQTDPALPDTLIGGPGDDEIVSGPGDDHLWGNGGDDWLTGGDGSDAISGDAGDDRLRGGTAAGTRPDADDGVLDTLDGGADIDECRGHDDTFINCES
jgi:Ca2+-binding RTX toxin-like protein